MMDEVSARTHIAALVSLQWKAVFVLMSRISCLLPPCS
jgi:hypothetical protein